MSFCVQYVIWQAGRFTVYQTLSLTGHGGFQHLGPLPVYPERHEASAVQPECRVRAGSAWRRSQMQGAQIQSQSVRDLGRTVRGRILVISRSIYGKLGPGRGPGALLTSPRGPAGVPRQPFSFVSNAKRFLLAPALIRGCDVFS